MGPTNPRLLIQNRFAVPNVQTPEHRKAAHQAHLLHPAIGVQILNRRASVLGEHD